MVVVTLSLSIPSRLRPVLLHIILRALNFATCKALEYNTMTHNIDHHGMIVLAWDVDVDDLTC